MRSSLTSFSGHFRFVFLSSVERSKALNHTAVRKIIKKFDKRFHVGQPGCLDARPFFLPFLEEKKCESTPMERDCFFSLLFLFFNFEIMILLGWAHWNKPFESKVHFQEVIPMPVMSPGTRRPGLHTHGSSIYIYTILQNSLYFYTSYSIKVYKCLQIHMIPCRNQANLWYSFFPSIFQ